MNPSPDLTRGVEGKTDLVVRNLLGIFILAIAYYSTARVGLAFAIPPGNATAVWPPSGISLAALLVSRGRTWPGIVIGASLVNFTASGVSFWAAVGFTAGSTIEILLAFWCCQRYLDLKQPFRSFRGAIVFISISAVSCAFAAAFGALSLLFTGQIEITQLLPNLSTWWLGDLTGIMLITPIVLYIPRRVAWHLRSLKTVEALLSLSILLLISQGIFGGWLPPHVAEGLLYVPLIVVFWLLLRFQPFVVFSGILLVSMVAVAGTSRGVGAFANEAGVQSLFDLHVFLCLYVFAGAALMGILSSGRKAELERAELVQAIKVKEQLRLRDAELAHALRLSTMGEMVAAIAHEINQPLYAVTNFAAASEKMLEVTTNEQSDKIRMLNRQIIEQTIRAGDIIQRLRDFIGVSDERRSVFFISDAVNDTVELMRSETDHRQMSVRIETATNPPPRVHADKIQVEQVIVNLLRNAFDAMLDTNSDNRVATIKTSLTEGEVHVSVPDNGIGFSAEAISKLFDPFYTTKESGMGMGMAISRTIVEGHSGRICVTPNTIAGTIVHFFLPLYQET